MNCQQVRALKHAYTDGELDTLRIIEVEEHLLVCPNCVRVCQNLQTLRSAVRSDALYFKAPAQLKPQIEAATRPMQSNAGGHWPFSRAWLKLAVPLGITAVAALVVTLILNQPNIESRVAQEITAGHVRSLMASHLTDVASTDQHTVKPWFAGKLDFSPPVVDLSARGFPLVGGRLDLLENRPVAALVYQRRKHIINLFIWPVPGGRLEEAAQTTARNGYNLVQWRQAGMAYGAVSDLNTGELLDFVHAIQAAQ